MGRRFTPGDLPEAVWEQAMPGGLDCPAPAVADLSTETIAVIGDRAGILIAQLRPADAQCPVGRR